MSARSPVQQTAGLVGAVFLLVGIAGFIPGITTNLYSGLPFAGHEASAELLGIFKVSVLHNLVHILLGSRGSLCRGASTERAAFCSRRSDLPRPLALWPGYRSGELRQLRCDRHGRHWLDF